MEQQNETLPTKRWVDVVDGYDSLFNVLTEALDQAQGGKGAERHNLGGGIPFERQRMQQISELIGSPDGMAYQVCKKVTEGVGLPTLDRQVAELLGAINYLAGMVIFLRRRAGVVEAAPDVVHASGCSPEWHRAAEAFHELVRRLGFSRARGVLSEFDAKSFADLHRDRFDAFVRRAEEVIDESKPFVPQPRGTP